MREGVDQVRPPSNEAEKAIASRRPAEKRAFCQTATSWPCGPAAIEPNPEAARTGAWVSGSNVPTACTAEMTMGADQVAPLSIERMIASVALAGAFGGVLSCVKKSISVPSV